MTEVQLNRLRNIYPHMLARARRTLIVCKPLGLHHHNTMTVLRMRLTRKRVELVPWSIAATRGPSVILFDDAAIVPFIESVSDHSSPKYKTGRWWPPFYSRFDVYVYAAPPHVMT